MSTGARELANTSSLPPFPEGWYFLATRQAVEKSKLLEQTWMGQNIIIWCDASGRISVARSVCPHLGSQLGPAAGGRVVDGRLVCPFHGFQYDADGQCVATPSAAPARSAQLSVFETRELNGLIFAWWGMDGRPPQWHLPAEPPDAGEWSNIQIRTVRFPGHPQETSENSVDIAHLSHVHGYGNVTNEIPVSIDGPYLESRFGFSTTRKIAKIARLNLEVTAIARVTGLGYSYVEFQELSIGIDARLWVLATPVDGTLIDMSIISQVREIRSPKRRIAGLGFLPRRMRAPIMNKFVADLQIQDVHQDVVVWSRKQYVPRPKLARSDGEVMKYRAYCAQFYPDLRQCESTAR
ncbi:Rieske 2Fe-2S domain-containing protein [Candidatus Poriferisodalis sp.]|uniref:Rieske 2Fe-2S domain-containing protein n=1 Tax=Candidatus Poriferisodalis sp. TaxID=3101277 RepID=UPI003B5CF976